MKFLLLSIVIILFASVLVVSQPQTPPQPDIVHIKGQEYLILGGGAYGVYRFQKNKKNNEA